jgi:Fe2+ transport system protein FeoA
LNYGGEMTLFDGSAGETYNIESICGTVRTRLSELGFNPGCKIKILNKQHTDMMVVNCRESSIALRKEEAQSIYISPVKE